MTLALKLPVPTCWYLKVECVRRVAGRSASLLSVSVSDTVNARFGDTSWKLEAIQAIVGDSDLGQLRGNVEATPADNKGFRGSRRRSVDAFDRQSRVKPTHAAKSVYKVYGVDRALQRALLNRIRSRSAFVQTDDVDAAYHLDPTVIIAEFAQCNLLERIESNVQLAARIEPNAPKGLLRQLNARFAGEKPSSRLSNECCIPNTHQQPSGHYTRDTRSSQVLPAS